MIMLGNQKSSRFFSFKGIALMAIALALLMNVTAFASESSRFAFIDMAAEFFGLHSSTSNTGTATTPFSTIAVSLPNVTATPGVVQIPITISTLVGASTDVISYDFNIDFDPTVVTPATPAFIQTGTISGTMSVTPNTGNPGHMIVSAFQGAPIADCCGQVLLFLRFNVIGAQGQSSPLVFADYTDPGPAFHPGFVFNEGDPTPFPITPGSIMIPFATATNTDTPTPSATSTDTPTGTNTPTATSTDTNTPTPTNTASNTSTPTPTPLCAQVDIEDSDAQNGQPVTLSVTTSDTTVLTPQAYAADFHIAYDPSVLATDIGPFYGVALGAVGLSNGSTLTVSHPSAGLLEISLFGTSPFSGAGDLVTITFPNVTGAPGTFSPVNFTPFPNHPGGFLYNEGFPTSCLTQGSVSIRGELSGNVFYRPVSAVQPRNVPNTTLTSTGGAPLPAPVLTDSAGNYSIFGYGPLSYTVTPSRAGSTLPDTHGSSISAYDASLTAQYVVDLIVLNADQVFVANVTGALQITSLDSSKMAQWAVGLPGTLFTGDWRFAPSSTTYPMVVAQVTNYKAYLMGDVSGNWCDPTSIPVLPCNLNGTVIGEARSAGGPERATSVKVQNVTTPAGTDVVVPVTVRGAANKGITAYQFDLRYDPSVIQPTANAVTLAGTVSDGYSVAFNPYTPGLLRVAVYGVTPLSDAGTLFNFHFTAVGDPLRVSPLTIENFMFNEGGTRTNVVNGQVEISTAAANTTARDN